MRADISLRDGDSFPVLLSSNHAEVWHKIDDSQWCSFVLQHAEGSEDQCLVIEVRKGDVIRIVRGVGGEALCPKD